MDEYTWRASAKDEVPGKEDFLDACDFVQDKLIVARKNIKLHPDSYSVNYGDSATIAWTTEDEKRLLTATQRSLTIRWNELVTWFNAYDNERENLFPGTKKGVKRLSNDLYWGCWRQSLGGGCGIEGICNFIVQQSVPKNDNTPVWGTRHEYHKDSGGEPK